MQYHLALLHFSLIDCAQMHISTSHTLAID